MRSLLLALLLLSSARPASAARNHLQPTDFEPLTSLPWKKPDAKLDAVLDTIFREPNAAIRYPVLAEYLRMIPVAKLNQAFDLCIDLEGTQTPDRLVRFFLPIWAKRDPKGCWKRTRELFRVVGFENGWLAYDSWEKRARITVEDLSAIRASRFWLGSNSLTTFPLGVDQSSLPKKKRVRILQEFTAMWFAAFDWWPVDPRKVGGWSYSADYQDSVSDLIAMFGRSVAELRSYAEDAKMSRNEAAFGIALRRWLQAEPASALQIVALAGGVKWPPDQHSDGDFLQLQIIWAKTDLPAMLRWAESPELKKDNAGLDAKGFLMSRVDAETRNRWLAEAKAGKPEDDNTISLLVGWAGWDPKAALDAAIATNDAEIAEEISNRAACGLWAGTDNTSHFGLGVIKDFDASRLPESYRKNHFINWEEIMEGWGDVDIGEAARYGLDFMLRNDYAPRDGLIKFFSGEDVYPDTGDMIDRTFCALRVWAVVKPDEMKAWIATRKDAEMRKALTWLLQHPWGSKPEK